MMITRSALAAGLGLCLALPAAAQYIGVLQSAQTMDRGTFKLMVAPIMVFAKDGTDEVFGVAARGGYGFTDRFDVEAKLGFSENGTAAGADAEYWILKNPREKAGLALSMTGGAHWMFGKKGNFDTMGLELTPQVSGHVNEHVELCAALDASFESIKDTPPGFDDSFTRMHLVPGLEYAVSDAVDLVGEIGIALNDDSFTYAGAGVAFYLR